MKIFNNAPPTPHSIDQNKSVERGNEKSRIGEPQAPSSAKGQVPVEISDEARFRGLAREVAGSAPDIRQEKVNALKAAIKAGTYHVDAKDIADKMVDEHLNSDFGKNNL